MMKNRFSAGDLRVVDGDDLEWRQRRYRLAGYDTPEIRNYRSRMDRDLESVRGWKAKHRLEVLIAGARSLHLIDWEQTVYPNRCLATLLIDGWDVSRIAMSEGWGVEYTRRRDIDWGDRRLWFPDLPMPD